MDTLALDTQIIYAHEDSGGSIQNDDESLLLQPNKPLTVGKDVSAKFATRLVEDKVCTVYSLPAEAPEVKEAPDAKSDDAKPAPDAKSDDAKPAPDAKSDDAKPAKAEGLVLG